MRKTRYGHVKYPARIVPAYRQIRRAGAIDGDAVRNRQLAIGERDRAGDAGVEARDGDGKVDRVRARRGVGGSDGLAKGTMGDAGDAVIHVVVRVDGEDGAGLGALLQFIRADVAAVVGVEVGGEVEGPRLAALVGGQAAAAAVVNGRAAGQQRVGPRRPAIVRQRAEQRVFAIDVVCGHASDGRTVGVADEVVVEGDKRAA